MTPSAWVCARLRPVFGGVGHAGDGETGALVVYVVCVAAAVGLVGGTTGHIFAAYGALPLAAAVGWDLGWRPSMRVAWGIATAVGCLSVATESHVGSLLAAGCATASLLALGILAGIDRRQWGLSAGDWGWWLPRTVAMVALVASTYLVTRGPTWASGIAPAADAAATELFLRGFLLFGLARRDAVLAVLLQALLAAATLPHSDVLAGAACFVVSVLAGWFCLRSRSVVPALLLHAAVVL